MDQFTSLYIFQYMTGIIAEYLFHYHWNCERNYDLISHYVLEFILSLMIGKYTGLRSSGYGTNDYNVHLDVRMRSQKPRT